MSDFGQHSSQNAAEQQARTDQQKREMDLRAQVNRSFTYSAPSPAQQWKYRQLRDEAKVFGHSLVSLCPLSRELSTALTKLEEVIMHANKAIACHSE